MASKVGPISIGYIGSVADADANNWEQGGNAFGAAGVLGTTDAQELRLTSDGSTVISLASDGGSAEIGADKNLDCAPGTTAVDFSAGTGSTSTTTGNFTWPGANGRVFTFGTEGVNCPRERRATATAGLWWNRISSAVTFNGVIDNVVAHGFNEVEGGGQDDLRFPSWSVDLEHRYQFGVPDYQVQAEAHLPQFWVTIASATGTAIGPFAVIDGDTFVVSVQGGGDQTATVQPGDIAIQGAATADELRVVIERDTTAKLAINADGRVTVYKVPTASADLDTIQPRASAITTACGFAVALATGALINRRPITLATNWRTAESEISVIGGLTIRDSSNAKNRVRIPDSPDDITVTIGDAGASVSFASVDAINIQGGAASLWQTALSPLTITGGTTLTLNSGSGALTITSGTSLSVGTTNGNLSFDVGGGGGAGILFKVGSATRFDVDVTAPNTTTLAGGHTLAGAAGAGALSFGAMTGPAAMPTGNLTWTGAAGKAVTFTAPADGALNLLGPVAINQGTVTITATGAASLDATTSVTIGGANATSVAIGRVGIASTVTGAFGVQTVVAAVTSGMTLARSTDSLWIWDSIGRTTTWQFGNAQQTNFDIHGTLRASVSTTTPSVNTDTGVLDIGASGVVAVTVGSLSGGSATTVRAQSGGLKLQSNFGTILLCGGSTARGLTVVENSTTEMGVGVLGTTTDLKITCTNLGLYGTAPAAQGAVGATLTNNVTAGGTANQLDDFTSLTIYATDAAAIRNNIYQLGLKLQTVEAKLKLLGAVKT